MADLGVPTFLSPKIPAKELSKGFELVFSPLRAVSWRIQGMENRNERFQGPLSDTKLTAIFTHFRAKKRAKWGFYSRSLALIPLAGKTGEKSVGTP